MTVPLNEKLMRLKQLSKLRPQYSEIYHFYTGLCQFLHQQQSVWLNCRPDLETWEQRRQAGFPLLTRTALQVDEDPARQFVCLLIDRLIALGQQGEADLQQLRLAIESKSLAVTNLLIACLEKDRVPLVEVAERLQIPAALLEYVCATALATGLQRWRETGDPVSLEGWQEGYCPLCGGHPAMGELVGEEGLKQLHCSLCALKWDVTRMKCSYCGNEESSSLGYFTAEGEPGYRVDICRKCSCYLKVVDSRELGEGLPMDIEDLNTMHLDLLAQQEGFAKGKIEQKN